MHHTTSEVSTLKTIHFVAVLAAQSATTILDFDVPLHHRPDTLCELRGTEYIPHLHDSKLLRDITRALLDDETIVVELHSNNPRRLVIRHSPNITWHEITDRVYRTLRQRGITYRYLGYRKDTLARRVICPLWYRLAGGNY